MNRSLQFIRILLIALAAFGVAADEPADAPQQKVPKVQVITHPPTENDLVRLRFSEMLKVTVVIEGGKNLEIKPPAKWTLSPGWKVKIEQPAPSRTTDTEPIWRQTFLLDPILDPIASSDQQVQLQPVHYRDSEGSWQPLNFRPFIVKVSTQFGEPVMPLPFLGASIVGAMASPMAGGLFHAASALIAERPPDIKNLRDSLKVEDPPDPAPGDTWLPLGLTILTTLLVISLAWLLWLIRLLRSSRTRTPEKTALYELDRLRALGLPHKGQVEEFHTLLANIVRRYLEKKYSIPARRMTTQEFGFLLDSEPRISAEPKAFLREFFEQCDLAKFADAAVPEATCDDRWRQAGEFMKDAASRAH